MALTREALEKLTKDELIEIILQLTARVAALEAQLRESRQAKAPFGKGVRKTSPKPPGRRAGEGNFTRRAEPLPGPADKVVALDAPLPADARNCPKCDVPLHTRNEVVTIEDMPKEPRRIITRISVEVGVCPICGYRQRGEHPMLGPHQCGANAHQVGSNVMAQSLALHYHSGLPLRKVPEVIKQTTGISITQGALTQYAGKLCESGAMLHGHYEDLRREVASSAVVNTDDTGWRVSATLAFLMGFFTGDTAYYQIRSRHRHQEVIEVLGAKFKGIVGTDRGTSYEAVVLEGWFMQKCLSHLLKNLSEVEASKTGRARSFSAQLKALLREALDLWKQYQEGAMRLAAYRKRGRKIARKISRHLRDRELSDADNQRLLNGIGHQHDKGRLVLFLEHPQIEPTNNRAERGLRPAVIARKVSQCSKNERGAQTYSVMKTVLATLRLRTKNTVQAFAALLTGAAIPQPGKG